jgi:EAL domain-containing protein (putative c-di-GMP-specific phosphodiesterase class I)
MDALILNVNRFRMINERYGKAYADEVLRRAGIAVKAFVKRVGGIACRGEADTFQIYCPHREDYSAFADEVASAAGGGMKGRIRVRLGVYAGVDKEIDMARRFDRAKSAADTIRSSYNVTVAVYDKTLHEKEMYAERLLDGFQEALDKKQFLVYFQPKYDIRPDKPVLCGAEALVRWKHPELGMISPGVFVPLFESNGLVRDLDHYVWRESAAQLKDWKKRLGKVVPVSINVSRVDMLDPDLLGTLKDLVEGSGLDYGDLHLEITESAYTQDAKQIVETVNTLRRTGFVMEMDDFGSGYSSLNMISTLPIDILKVDMFFIRHAFSEGGDTRMLKIIVDIADSLKVPMIAEGVETKEQMLALKDLGCDIVQGYYFSRPVPAEEFERFLEEE